jgi:ABC-type transport system substrate-binding protein
MRLSYYANETVLYLGLKAGEIDLMGWPLTAAQYADAITDPDIVVCPGIENGMFQFDFNNNYTLPDGSLNPMHVLAFRQAVALCVDKVNIITNICGGHALRLDTPFTSNPNYGYWWKEEVAYPNYPYEYNPAAAAALLDLAGFTIKGGDTLRSWPDGSALPALKFYIRSTHEPRRLMGLALAGELEDLGIDVNELLGPGSYSYGPVMGQMDYHIYTGGWSLGVQPTLIYSLYNYKGWYPYGPNYVTGEDENGEPNYPDFDYWSEKLYYANDAEEALEAAIECQNIMVENCFDVWCYAAKGYYAYRNLLGVVNYKAYGTYTSFTFLNAYPANGENTIKMGTKEPPTAVNVITSSWVWDWQHLDRLYDTLTGKSPYDLGTTGDQPGIAQDWKVETWVDPEDAATKTKLTFWLREDAKCCDGTDLTAYDVEWCLWYHYAVGFADWNFESIMDIKKINVLDAHTIEIYLNVKSMFALYFMNVPLFQEHIWNREPLVHGPHVHEWHVNATIAPGDHYVIPERGVLPGVVIMKDGIPLIPDVDYYVEGTVWNVTQFCHNKIHWLRPLAECQNIVFTYYIVGDYTGFLPGSLPASEILVGSSMYKYVSNDPLVYMLFERADHYYLNVPLGEIDWRYYTISGGSWSSRTLPPPKNDGYYTINIYDVVTVATAYYSRGTAIPDANWQAGADLAAPVGFVNIYDVVTVTGKYGMKWGSPPPNPPPA